MSAQHGDSASVTHRVETTNTADAVGSGDLQVLGTPVVVAWCEEATCAALNLDDDSTSVGTRISMEHMAASPIGATITATATVTAVDGRQVAFDVVARDQDNTMVAHGQVRRVIVNRDRFLSRVPLVKD